MMQRILFLTLALWVSTPALSQYGAGGGGSGGGSGRGNGNGASLEETISVLGVMGLLFWRAHYRGEKAKVIAGSLEITEVPPGEAPLEIRQAWVGVSVPIIKRTERPIKFLVIGLYSGEAQGYVKGYQSPGAMAVDCLEKQAPEAADWWRQNAPRATQPNFYFIFPADCGIRHLDDGQKVKENPALKPKHSQQRNPK